jgi:hypothetical protein
MAVGISPQFVSRVTEQLERHLSTARALVRVLHPAGAALALAYQLLALIVTRTERRRAT